MCFVTRCIQAISEKQNREESILMNGFRLSNLRYAGDRILFADEREGRQNFMNKIHEPNNNHGLEINTFKTKFGVMSKKNLRSKHVRKSKKNIKGLKVHIPQNMLK